MDARKIEDIKHFVEQCRANPSIIHNPSLAFFKSFLESMGARIPPPLAKSDKDQEHLDSKKSNFYGGDVLDEEIIESDVELDNSDVVEPDNDPRQQMGDSSIEVTEENRDAAQMLKSRAMDAISAGKLNESIDFLTEAIMLNPTSAILYATRASVFIKLKKPNAAILDADAALQINPDSAKGYKAQGIAKSMLGLWEEAASDLHVASKLDYDEEIALVLKKVEANVHKLQEHRRKYERLRKEKELKRIKQEKQQQKAEAQAAAASALKDGEVIGLRSLSELENKLDAASKTSRLAILYFTATWCGPCRFISPLYTSLAGKYSKVVFLKADIDEAGDVAAKWKVSSVPTFFFIKDKNVVDQVVGADKSSLEKKIAEHAS